MEEELKRRAEEKGKTPKPEVILFMPFMAG